MWFHKNDLKFHASIADKSIRGYVLPHAGTTYSGKIISHTLRFKPTFKFKKVCILYYPVSDMPNVQGKYYHEYFVPMKSIKLFVDHKWGMKKISYYGINLRDEILTEIDLSDTLIVVSADFSHFLPLQDAIDLENKAAHALMFKQHKQSSYINIVDHVISFKALQKLIPSEWLLQWIGRTRSLNAKDKNNKEGVGYLSFLIKEPPKFVYPDGMFITCYDNKMNARECLGEWFDTRTWSQNIESQLIKKVIRLGKSTSRLTGSRNIRIPITYYTVTYLYRDKKSFIRGYHGIKRNAFYLPDVFLEHTFPTGKWIQQDDTVWEEGRFMMKETLTKLSDKAGSHASTDSQLYRSEVRHVKI